MPLASLISACAVIRPDLLRASHSLARSKLLGDGWEFAAPEKTLGKAEEDFGVDAPDEKRRYFEDLAKLNEDGHSLAEYCQGLGLDDDDSGIAGMIIIVI